MRYWEAVLALPLSVLATCVSADEKRPLKKWSDLEELYGPRDETRVMKYTDVGPGYVVICYLYVPDSVGTAIACTGSRCDTRFQGDIGSISCVNVTPPPAPKVAETPSVQAPTPSATNATKQH